MKDKLNVYIKVYKKNNNVIFSSSLFNNIFNNYIFFDYIALYTKVYIKPFLLNY